ncbi:enoyl-CoA hydratase/isomerase family protein [Sphingomonas sp. SUN039]|uniref:enoyl-CoA hydratase/isomerase family protein n=1 Tax=Sphingomonas sp. SUN039 TaxID=2937787 RepID=UPI002164CEB1|nr:enoyl-CoA hydratase/isomerase family protein [Sphingomonas sp. SUN039]UVO52692.1 enoyl-CoA hydratase/isomerase family protein [Sphingomonas sp. SUN039]
MNAEVLIAKEGHLGRIRLNRPKALNALTTDMCLRMLDALADFEADDEIALVVIDHAQGRGFCAGGDIRMLSDSMKGDGVAARAFFHTEYRLDHRLFTYPKPTVSIMDGITMGGGVGIALPCRYRIATENTRFAMPETGIGLFPDVGGSWYLSRLPGQVGKFMGLTGARLDGAECLALGLATHYIASADVPAAIAALNDSADIFATLKSHGVGAPLARIVENRTHIDRLFAGDSVAGIMAALEADGSEWALKELATLRSKSPLSMAVALRQLREGAAMTDFADIMRMEYRIAVRVLAHPDFIEGVRAVVIDKDNAPRWVPDASSADVDAVFAPLPAEQEWTPLLSSPRA